MTTETNPTKKHETYVQYRDNRARSGACHNCGQPSYGFFRCAACRNRIGTQKAARQNKEPKPMPKPEPVMNDYRITYRLPDNARLEHNSIYKATSAEGAVFQCKACHPPGISILGTRCLDEGDKIDIEDQKYIRDQYIAQAMDNSEKTVKGLKKQFHCQIGWIENQHAAHIFHDSFERHVASNPGIVLDDELWDIAYRAMDALGDLYFAIAQRVK